MIYPLLYMYKYYLILNWELKALSHTCVSFLILNILSRYLSMCTHSCHKSPFLVKKTKITVPVWSYMTWNFIPLDRSFSVLLKKMPQAGDMFCT